MSAKRSKGFRKEYSTVPSFNVQFDTTTLRSASDLMISMSSQRIARWFACALAVQALVALPSCREKEEALLSETKEGKYQVGEKWKFRSRPGEENATLTIVKVESNAKLGVIVHVSVEGVRIKSAHAPSGFSETVAHMPFAETAIEKSVTSLVAKGVTLPKFEEGYREWRTAFDNNKGGLFTITVGEGIDFMEKALNQ